jgi:hypothetical protein
MREHLRPLIREPCAHPKKERATRPIMNSRCRFRPRLLTRPLIFHRFRLEGHGAGIHAAALTRAASKSWRIARVDTSIWTLNWSFIAGTRADSRTIASNNCST